MASQYFPLGFLIPLLYVFTGCQSAEKPAPEDFPNIILIMTDDQGYGDLGFHGNEVIQTPRLDELARNSGRFRQFYVSPVCAPTRASLLTGRFTLRTGVSDTYNGGAMMAGRETTIAEILSAAGYRTGVFGKWHLGDSYPFRPGDQGFEESLVHLAGGIGQVGDHLNYFQYDSSYFDPTLLHNGEPMPTQGYCSDVYTDAAIEFMDEQETDPFFLYLAFNAPHTPLQVPKGYYNRYAALDSIPGKAQMLASGVGEEQLPSVDVIRRLYGMITNIDDNVGRLVDHVEASGLADNTILVFLTDNGPQQYRYNASLRNRKGSVYEGGIRVPGFFHWPGRLEAGREIDGYAAHLDMLPTLLGLAGIPVPDTLALDGNDYSLQLLGEIDTMPEPTLFFQWQRGYPEPYRNIAVRRGDYKLVGQTGYEASLSELELFNLREDPGEQINLVAQQPELAQELKSAFDEWLPDVLSSPSVGNTDIVIGSDYENPVVLNRNDARGSPGIWRQNQVYGYWDVEVTEAGLYDFRIQFFEPVGTAGEVLVRIGSTQRTVRNEDPEAMELTIEGVPLNKGRQMVESWYVGQGWRGSGGPAFTHFPMSVEVERIE